MSNNSKRHKAYYIVDRDLVKCNRTYNFEFEFDLTIKKLMMSDD